jgi:hypothetical protein
MALQTATFSLVNTDRFAAKGDKMQDDLRAEIYHVKKRTLFPIEPKRPCHPTVRRSLVLNRLLSGQHADLSR